MAEKNSEKINFNVTPTLKKNLEVFAYSRGMSLSEVLIELCTNAIKANSERIKRQRELIAEPVNNSDTPQVSKPKRSKKKSAPIVPAASDSERDKEKTVKVNE